MMQIYCLVDPRSNKPFYVGATKAKLSTRLSSHIHDAVVFKTTEYAMSFTAYKKHFLIKELVQSGMRPRIDLLYICNEFTVEFYEFFFYQLLTTQGFTLFNWKQYFNYNKYQIIDNSQVNKNTSIIIW